MLSVAVLAAGCAVGVQRTRPSGNVERLEVGPQALLGADPEGAGAALHADATIRGPRVALGATVGFAAQAALDEVAERHLAVGYLGPIAAVRLHARVELGAQLAFATGSLVQRARYDTAMVLGDAAVVGVRAGLELDFVMQRTRGAEAHLRTGVLWTATTEISGGRYAAPSATLEFATLFW